MRQPKWTFDVGKDALTGFSDNRITLDVSYSELCRIQKIGLWQNLNSFFMHLKDSPEVERFISGEPVRGIVPLGFELRNVFRRLFTFSSDLLLQSYSGKTALIPLRALNREQRQQFWTALALKRADLLLRDRHLLKTALKEERLSGELLRNQRSDQARQQFQTARTLWEKVGYMECVERCLRHEVKCLLLLGEYGEAGGLSARALELARNLHNLNMGLDQRRNIADNLADLGNVQWSVGGANGLATALAYLREAESYYRELGLQFFECRMQSNQSLIYERLYTLTGNKDDIAECRRLGEKALRSLPARWRGDRLIMVRVQEANIRGTLARCDFYEGDWAGAARQFEAAHDKAFAVARGDIPEDVAMWGRTLFRKSQEDGVQSVAESLRGLDKAINELNRAVQMSQGTGSLQICLEVYSLRGDTFWEMGNLEAAISDYEVVVTLLESDKFAFARPYDRVGNLRRYQRIYRRLVEALLTLAERKPEEAQQRIKAAFQHNERIKARTLAELLSLSRALLSTIPDALRESFEIAKRSLQEAYLRMEVLQKGHQDVGPATLSAALQRLQHAQENYDTLFRRVIEAVPGFAESISPKPPSISKVMDWLPRDGSGAVLEFCIGDEKLCVFLVTQQGDIENTCFTIQDMGLNAIDGLFLRNGFLHEYDNYADKKHGILALEKQYFDSWNETSTLGFSVSNSAPQPSPLQHFLEEHDRLIDESDELLVQWVGLLPDLLRQIDVHVLSASGSKGISIRSLLAERNITRLVVVPDGLLHRLPLHAAFGEHLEVTYDPSSAVLIQTIQRSSEATSPDTLLVSNPAHGIGALRFNLEEAACEARLVSGRLRQNGYSVQHLAEQTADSETIMESMSGKSWCHFSMHAMSNYIMPLGSHLKVSHAPQHGIPANWEDGLLTAQKLMLKAAVSHGTQIIVPACEAGVTPHDLGGEYVGLPAAFLIAGASSVLVPLWTVHAGTPIIIMDRFYKNALEGRLSNAAALKEACAYLRTMTLEDVAAFENREGLRQGIVLSVQDAFREPGHPWHWAGFVACGAAWPLHDVSGENTHPEESNGLPELQFQLGIGISSEARDVLKQVNRLFDQGQYREALPLLESAIQKRSGSADLHDAFSEAYMRVGELEQALDHSLEAVRRDPNNSKYYYNLGCSYRDCARVSEARACFQKAIALNPGYAKALFNLAQLEVRPEKVLQLLDTARLIDPNDADTARGLAMWRQIVGQEPDTVALLHLQAASDALNKNEINQAQLHLALARETPLTTAHEALALSIESDILRKDNDFRASIGVLREATRIHPDPPAYFLNNLAARGLRLAESPGISFKERKSLYESVKRDALKAISLANYAKPHQNLAYAYLATGHLAAAREEAASALELALWQMQRGHDAVLRCKGCPTMGKDPVECTGCLQKAKAALRDVDLTTGDYRIG